MALLVGYVLYDIRCFVKGQWHMTNLPLTKFLTEWRFVCDAQDLYL